MFGARIRSLTDVGSRRAIASCLIVFLSVPAATFASSWTQWRGPQRDGSVESAAWPRNLDGIEKQWQVSLGPSYSGPIVADGRVFVTETHDKKDEIVRALDQKTGEELWRVTWSGAMKVPFFAARNGSWIRATPAYAEGLLFVPGIREVVVALDAETGDVRWQIDFPDTYETGLPPFGYVCSPLVDGEHLYVEAAGSVFKLVAATGEVVWRTTETWGIGDMMAAGTFSSPVMATLDGVRQLLVQTRTSLKGIDPERGTVLWSQAVPSFRGMNILTPMVTGTDRVFTSTYRNAAWSFRVRRAGEGETAGWTVEESWESDAKAYMSSPVQVGDHLYVHQGNGRLTALDASNGESLWTSGPLGSYWSMAWQDDLILGLSNEGTLHLVAAEPERFEELASHDLDAGSETWAHLAVAGDQLFVRALDGLIALRWGTTPAEDDTSSTAAP